jgi:hypothetical protein
VARLGSPMRLYNVSNDFSSTTLLSSITSTTCCSSWAREEMIRSDDRPVLIAARR